MLPGPLASTYLSGGTKCIRCDEAVSQHLVCPKYVMLSLRQPLTRFHTVIVCEIEITWDLVI